MSSCRRPRNNCAAQAFRRPEALPPPDPPATTADTATREKIIQKLIADLAACTSTLLQAKNVPRGLNDEPAIAIGAALTEWAKACEAWLCEAAGNDGQLPNKSAGRCAPPTRQKTRECSQARTGWHPHHAQQQPPAWRCCATAYML